MDNKDNSMKDNSSKQILLSVLGVAILVVAVVGVSFAAFTYTGIENPKNNTITTGTLSMKYEDDTNGINISNAMPMSDANGKILNGQDQYFDFTVGAEISGTATINFEIAADKQASSTLQDDQVHLYLEEKVGGAYSQVMAPTIYTPKTQATDLGTPAGDMVLYKGSFNATLDREFRLRMWMTDQATFSNDALATSKTYTVKVNVYGKA